MRRELRTKSRIAEKKGFARILFVFMAIYSFALLAPILWLLLTSLKSYQEYTILNNIIGFPKESTFADIVANFKMAWTEGYSTALVDGQTMYFPILTQFMNSLLYAVGSSLTATMVPCLTAYVTARYPYKFSTVIHTIALIVLTIPIIGSEPSSLEMTRNLGMYDHFWGMYIMKGNFVAGSYYLIFHAQFRTISYNYTEAARIDGASHFTIMTRVILPLVKGVVSTVFLLIFVVNWNDYQGPLLYLPSHPVLALGMFQFSTRPGVTAASVPLKIAYMVLTSMPIIIFFIATHKRLMEGNLGMGGIKE